MNDIVESNQNLNTVLNAVRIVEAIEELDGATVKELCAHLDMAMSTIHDYVVTLTNAHYLTRTDDEYRLGLKFFEHGMRAKDSVAVVDIASPTLEKISEETGETVWLAVEEYWKSVLIEQANGENSVPMEASLGDRVAIHSVASGKVILAYRETSYVQALIDQYGLAPRTEHTITDEATFFEELEAIRERGYAVNRQESIDGLRSVSAPIQNDGEPIAAISIAGPVYRLTDAKIDGELSTLLLESSNEIELKMEYS